MFCLVPEVSILFSSVLAAPHKKRTRVDSEQNLFLPRHIGIVVVLVKNMVHPLDAVQSVEDGQGCIRPAAVGQLDNVLLAEKRAELVVGDANVAV